MAKQAINNHKRMAMGGNARGYAAGGAVLPAQAGRAATPATSRGMPSQATPQLNQAFAKGGKVKK